MLYYSRNRSRYFNLSSVVCIMVLIQVLYYNNNLIMRSYPTIIQLNLHSQCPTYSEIYLTIISVNFTSYLYALYLWMFLLTFLSLLASSNGNMIIKCGNLEQRAI